MKPVTSISGIAVPFPAPNIDTDQIVPSAFLTAVDRVGFGRALFHEQRFDGDGRPVADFVLNRPPYDRASILVAGDNFGCGSSREHAAWALVDFGIGCVVSTRVADIFFKNAVNNGLLPCLVTPEVHSALLAAAHDARPFVVDLATQTIAVDGQVHPFAIDAAAKQRLLSGEDLIDATLTQAGAIDAIEHALEASMPWLPRRVAS